MTCSIEKLKNLSVYKLSDAIEQYTLYYTMSGSFLQVSINIHKCMLHVNTWVYMQALDQVYYG